MKLYLRFTENLEKDRERGFSFYKGGKKQSGLCAWTTPFFYNGDNFIDGYGNEVEIAQIKECAQEILTNTYGSYSSNSSCYLITGNYVGSGNDGVLLQDVREIDHINF